MPPPMTAKGLAVGDTIAAASSPRPAPNTVAAIDATIAARSRRREDAGVTKGA